MKRSFTNITLTTLVLFLLGWSQPAFAQEYRTINGLNNNLSHPEWGAAGENQLRISSNGYADGMYLPGGTTRPNPRLISNMLFSQNTLANDPLDLSAYVWGWGQFVDHDITLTSDHPVDALPIVVPPFDPYFDPAGTGNVVIPMKRANFDPTTGTSPDNPRMHPNEITAFIDASAVYGSDPQRASWLRTFEGGKLKVSAGNLLPYNTTTSEFDGPVDPNAPPMAMPLPNAKYFVAGDVRCNENPFLTTLHTLFVREHNRVCDELAAAHPTWTDHQIYQQARKLVGAYMQAITYEEWLPALGMTLEPYIGYDPSVDPQIMNEFSTAAYRYGHTTITGVIPRMDNDGNTIPEGDILLRHAFFNPSAIADINGGIEPYLVGMATLVQQNFDCKVIDDLRNFLFGQPGSGGMDLVAINVNRGRDRGLTDYNTMRVDFGLDPVSSFQELTSDPLMALAMQDVYGSVNNIDPWVGFLAEDHMNNAMFGPTVMAIVKRQFKALRDGDRFFYENDPWLTPDEKNEIRGTRLSDIIRRNTGINSIDDDIFIVGSLTSSNFDARTLPVIDLTVAPNPTKGPVSATLTVSEYQNARLQLIDLRGAVLWEKDMDLNVGENQYQFNLDAGYPAGQYFLVVKTGLRTSTYKTILKLN